VPVYPSLATKLPAYIAKRRLKPKDRLFSGYRGGELNYRVLDKALKRAREVVMPEQVESSLAKTLYDWRRLCLTNWTNRGIPPSWSWLLSRRISRLPFCRRPRVALR
jgi:hypothetical protein